MKTEESRQYGLKEEQKKINMQLLLVLLVMMGALFLLLCEVDIVLAQTVDAGSAATEAGGEIIQSTQESGDKVENWMVKYWNVAGDYANYISILIALILGASFGLSVFWGLEGAGVWGAIAAFFAGAILGWAVWGIWDQATKGHIIPLILVALAWILSLSGRSWQGGLGIAATIVIYFWIILDSATVGTRFWDSFNVLRLTGADSWSDLLNWDVGVCLRGVFL